MMNEKDTIRNISTRLIKAQGPVLVLNSVRWTDGVRDGFFADHCAKLPEVDTAWYQNRPLGFDPVATREEFSHIATEVKKTLGAEHPAGAILIERCREYEVVIRMLENRGNAEFGTLARELYGSTKDPVHPDGKRSLADYGKVISDALDRIEPCMNMTDPYDERNISGENGAKILQEHLDESMSRHGHRLIVVADDGITADASAGADKIKLRVDATFSRRDLRLLEVHEGWIHVGTTLNGLAQSVCQFLSKGTPSSTITQEGLAVLMEIIAFASSPTRQRRLNNRIIAVKMAEDGADFLDVFGFYRDKNFSEAESYQFATRVFRGSTPNGKPFTKDLAYTAGFVQLYNFLHASVHAGRLENIPLMFCGKTVLGELSHLRHLQALDLLDPPTFIPPNFADIHGLAAWVCYDSGLAALESEGLQERFLRNST